MTKKELRRMIEDLELQTQFRTAVVLALVEAVKPSRGFRLHYTMHAIKNAFTAKEIEQIDRFFRWAARRDDSITARDIYGPLNRDDLIEAFDEFVPARQGQLEEILRIDREDGDMGVWMKWSNIVLNVNDHSASNAEANDTNENEVIR